MRRFLVFCLLALSVGFAFAALDQSTPKKTVESFFLCFKTDDIGGMISLVSGGKASANSKQFGEQLYTADIQIETKIAKSQIKGSTAMVRTVTTIIGKKTTTYTEDLKLQLINKKWMLVAPKQPTTDELLNTLIYTLRHGDEDVKMSQGPDSACLLNIKQLGIAACIFLADNDDTWAFKETTWRKELEPYCKDAKLFKCPLVSTKDKSYSFNFALFGKSQSSVEYVESTVMIYEGKNRKLNFRHHGRAAVAFTDGHAKLVTPEEAKKLRWKL